MKAKKEKLVGAKVTKEQKEEFEEACEKQGTYPSYQLRQFIRQYISSSKSKRIPM